MYLNLQDIISPYTLVMHLVIGIICIATTLVFNKGKSADRVSMLLTFVVERVPFLGNVQSACSASWSGNVTAHKASIAEDVLERGWAGTTGWQQDGDGDGETRVSIGLIYRCRGGQAGRGREVREDFGRTVRTRRLGHGLACHDRSQ